MKMPKSETTPRIAFQFFLTGNKIMSHRLDNHETFQVGLTVGKTIMNLLLDKSDSFTKVEITEEITNGIVAAAFDAYTGCNPDLASLDLFQEGFKVARRLAADNYIDGLKRIEGNIPGATAKFASAREALRAVGASA
jgi:hypothetical protein